MQLDPCLDQNIGRRRAFWATQINACGSLNICGTECAVPGLQYEDKGPAVEPEGPPRTIKTEGWLQSLILNILNTKARTDMPCPSPAGTLGHWSESYRDDGLYIGSTLWNAAAKKYIRTADGVKAIAVAIRADMGKLIALGIAKSIEVEATYKGSNSVAVEVVVHTSAGVSRIGLMGSFVSESESWVWRQ